MQERPITIGRRQCRNERLPLNELRVYYNAFKDINPKTAKLMQGFQPQDDKENPPLQAADMAANFTLEKSLEFRETNQRLDSLEQMEGSIQRLCVWNEHYMLSVLKRHLIRTNKPIPPDLRSDSYG